MESQQIGRLIFSGIIVGVGLFCALSTLSLKRIMFVSCFALVGYRVPFCAHFDFFVFDIAVTV